MSLLDMNGYAPTIVDLLIHIVPGVLIYQMLGAIRHVIAHAFMYHLGGYKVTELRLYPHMYHCQFYWAYYRTTPQGGAKYSAVMELAPYWLASISIGVWTLVMYLAAGPWANWPGLSWHLKMAFTMLFMVSPFVDIAINLFKFMLGQGDIARAYRRWKVYR